MVDKAVIIKELKNSLSLRFNDDLKEIVLFGSQLRAKTTNDSDFDILIILKHKANWKTEREISDLCYEIDLKDGIITDTHILGEEELELPRGKQPIFVNAIAKGIHA